MDKATVMSPTFVKATFMDPSAVHCDPLRVFKPDVTEAGSIGHCPHYRLSEHHVLDMM